MQCNAANRDILAQRLPIKGYIVDIANGGIDKLIADNWELILMDISLATRDDLTASQGIRRISIVPFNAHTLSNNRETALYIGCNGLVSNPIVLNKFLEKIECVLE